MIFANFKRRGTKDENKSTDGAQAHPGVLPRTGWTVHSDFCYRPDHAGDTARMALGPRAPEEAVEALREEMHLNDST